MPCGRSYKKRAPQPKRSKPKSKQARKSGPRHGRSMKKNGSQDGTKY